MTAHMPIAQHTDAERLRSALRALSLWRAADGEAPDSPAMVRARSARDEALAMGGDE